LCNPSKFTSKSAIEASVESNLVVEAGIRGVSELYSVITCFFEYHTLQNPNLPFSKGVVLHPADIFFNLFFG
jgi:hypothetical protein